jgi:hypothetical protein
MAPSTSVPVEALVMLRRRLAALPAKHHDRQQLLLSTGTLYGVSRATLYRLLRGGGHPRHAHRADRGRPRVLSGAEVEGWCEIIAAMKVRTTNRKGRHLSTVRILELLEKHGVETPDGLQKLPPGKLTASTINRHMRRLGYDNERMTRPPPAVRFQAEQSNALWHFDMSPSELKQLAVPPWIDPDRNGAPTLMLFSVVDDRSGVAYQEYRCVYGEDAESALRFLFNAMSAKPDEANPFQGVPTTLYLDNGPVAKSGVFQRVMESLNIEAIIHMPAGSDGRRTTARAKGKVERPFRTVKDAHETLYHFHQPETEEEANRWLARYIATYNSGDHRSEPHSRLHDWLGNLPPDGVRQMCAWERFCTFAREPERRAVGIDCRITVAGVTYEVDPDLAGETVVVWWGLFDQELFVEQGEERFGPYTPVGGPIPLHRYRKHRKGRREVRADKVGELAAQLKLPRSALSGEDDVVMIGVQQDSAALPSRPFRDPLTKCASRWPSCPMTTAALSMTCFAGRWLGRRFWRRYASDFPKGAEEGSTDADRSDGILRPRTIAGRCRILRD